MKLTGIPTLRDPRMLVLVFFAVLDFYALIAPGFSRTPLHFGVAVVICVGLDILLSWTLKKEIVFPLSALLTANGVFLLVDSPLIEATAAAAALSILSKHFFKINGNHIFNPNNFGVALLCWAYPDWIVSGAHRWAGRFELSVILLIIGTAIVIRVDRWRAVYSYLFAFIGFNVIRAFMFHKVFWVYSLSLLGPAMQLFIFFMVSDPRTSPSDPKRQVVYGVSLALLDNIFRHLELRDAPLFALFVVCLVYNLYRALKPDKIAFNLWKTRDLVPARTKMA